MFSLFTVHFYFAENHELVFINSGFKEGRLYRYWDDKNRRIDFEGLKEDLENAPEKAVIVLHACAHNPSGNDLTPEQWEEVADIIKVSF